MLVIYRQPKVTLSDLADTEIETPLVMHRMGDKTKLLTARLMFDGTNTVKVMYTVTNYSGHEVMSSENLKEATDEYSAIQPPLTQVAVIRMQEELV